MKKTPSHFTAHVENERQISVFSFGFARVTEVRHIFCLKKKCQHAKINAYLLNWNILDRLLRYVGLAFPITFGFMILLESFARALSDWLLRSASEIAFSYFLETFFLRHILFHDTFRQSVAIKFSFMSHFCQGPTLLPSFMKQK